MASQCLTCPRETDPELSMNRCRVCVGAELTAEMVPISEQEARASMRQVVDGEGSVLDKLA